MATLTWKVEDRHRLLAEVAEKLAGNAHISFEGSLSVLNLAELPGASDSETNVLRRNTIWPKQDFLVFPLEKSTFEVISRRMGYRVPSRIIHIQIEKNGILESGAYDNFDADSITWGPALVGAFIESMVSKEILSPASRNRK